MKQPKTEQEWAELRRQTLDNIDDIIAQVGLPKVLLPYQSRVVKLLEGVCPVLFIEKSRRIGLTWGLASYAALRAGREKKAGGMDVMYISYSKEMTREFIDDCAMWSRAYSMAASECEEFLFDDSDPTGDRSIQAFRIKFASGFEIVALSSAPRGLRGKQGVVIIDEAAFVDSLEQLLKSALAFLMWGGQVIVCSTHNGTDNTFNLEIQEILGLRSKYQHIRIDFDDALKQGLYERMCLVLGKEWSPEGEAEYRQEIIEFYRDDADEELFCIAAQGSGTWLPGPLIEARMTADAPILRLELPADYLQRSKLDQDILMSPFLEDLKEALETLDLSLQFAFGFDFARVADLTVGSLLAIERNLTRREALCFELRNVPGDEQKLITKTVLDFVLHRLIGAAFDATGMGWTVAEDMGRLYGFREDEESAGLVWAIKFSQEWYRINMPPLKVAFEDEAIWLIADAEHASDLRLVKMIRGIPRVPDVREGQSGKKRHGDFAIALALAHFASRMRWYEYAYRGASDEKNDNWSYAQNDDDPRPGQKWWRQPKGASLRGSI